MAIPPLTGPNASQPMQAPSRQPTPVLAQRAGVAVAKEAPAPEAWALATDATGKFMGAGAMGQAGQGDEQARAAAAYQAVMLAEIPAVGGVPASLGLAAYTGNTPRGQSFSQTPGTPRGVRVPRAQAPENPTLDLLA